MKKGTKKRTLTREKWKPFRYLLLFFQIQLLTDDMTHWNNMQMNSGFSHPLVRQEIRKYVKPRKVVWPNSLFRRNKTGMLGCTSRRLHNNSKSMTGDQGTTFPSIHQKDLSEKKADKIGIIITCVKMAWDFGYGFRRTEMSRTILHTFLVFRGKCVSW